MAFNGTRLGTTLVGNVVVRVGLYYTALLGAAYLAWRAVQTPLLAPGTVGAVSALDAFGGAARRATPAAGAASPVSEAAVAMAASVLLSLPVAWVYVLTRAKRGYQQSVVQTLIILPVVVAGIVVLVKDSLALAFGLAGIVAAVRFRIALDDSKDGVYVFLAIGVGLATAVNVWVAAVISVMFNAVILALWYTEFGRTPAHLDGRMADRKLRRAMEQLSRTGTFVARIDDEVFEGMSAEQLQAVADRAWRRARRNNPEPPDPEGRQESLLRIRTHDVAASRATVEPLLEEHLKRWRYGGVVHEPDGADVIEYTVLLKRNAQPAGLLDTMRTAAHVVGAEFD